MKNSEHINFLEPRKFSLNKIEFNYFFIVVVAGGLLLSFMIYGIMQKSRIDSKNADLVAALAEVERLTTASQSIIPADPLQKSPFVTVLQTRVQWSGLVNAIAMRSQRSLNILSLRGEHGVLKIQGEAVNLESVMQFKSRLGSQPALKRVTLVSSAEEGSSDQKRVAFELECTL